MSERALLSAVMFDASQLARVADVVSAADFADPDLGRLFEALQTMTDAGLPICDPYVLVPELARLRVPESVCSTAFIAKLIVDGNVHVHHADFYAREIRRTAILRRLQALGADLTARCSDRAADPQRIAAWLDAHLQASGQDAAQPSRTIGEIAAEVIADLKRPPETRTRGVMAGFALGKRNSDFLFSVEGNSMSRKQRNERTAKIATERRTMLKMLKKLERKKRTDEEELAVLQGLIRQERRRHGIQETEGIDNGDKRAS